MPIKFNLPSKETKKKTLTASSGGYVKNSSSNTNSEGRVYAATDFAHAPMSKFAQTAGGVGAIMTQPMFFSPLHTPQNWQIASKRREIYQWQIIGKQGLTVEDHTQIPIEDFMFYTDSVVEDTVTGGKLYENIISEKILGGSGEWRNPVHFSVRDCIDKRCFGFSAYGHWRELQVSEEHPLIVLDGNLYRKKKKIESNSKYRRKKGLSPNGVQKVNFPDKLIFRKEAKDVCEKDYILLPVSKCGVESLEREKAWMIGLCIADGCISSYKNDLSKVSFTYNKSESWIEEYLEEELNSFGRINSNQHGNGNGYRTTIWDEPVTVFFEKYITGKLSKKKFKTSVFDLDKESRLHLLGGYFDGDGSFTPNDGKLVANNYSKDMTDQLYTLLLSVGIQCSVGKYEITGEHYKTTNTHYYRIFIPCSEVIKLQPYMKSKKLPQEFKAKTKRELRFFYEEDNVTYYAQPIDKIREFYYTGKGYDLQIDPERSFVANGYLVSNCRFYYENEAKVAAAVDFNSSFPMNGFDLECKSKKVLKYYQKAVDDLNINSLLKLISKEYFLLGDVFPFKEIACSICNGTGVKTDGTACSHPGGKIKRIVILNPDWVEVQKTILSSEPVIAMVPDEELRSIVQRRQPRQIYDKLPPALIGMVASGQPIPLSNRSVSHLKHNETPYGVYGISLLRRVFQILAYKTKIMTANWIVAERMILPVRVVKVGNDNRPAGPEDIADVANQLAHVANDPNLTLVTHHAFEYDWHGATGKIHQITQELEYIGKEILDGFMLNQSLLNGEGPAYGCHDQLSRVLTSEGFKHYWEITKNDKIATYNKINGNLEWQKSSKIHIYDFDGEMYKFKTNKIDMLVTPNHRMLFQKRDSNEWIVDEAQNVKDRAKFVRTTDWVGEVNVPEFFKDKNITLDQILKLYGYYVSEGSLAKNRNGKFGRVQLHQCAKGKGWNDLCNLQDECEEYNIKFSDGGGDSHRFIIYNVRLAEQIQDECDHLSQNKKLPKWIKNLPKKYLKNLLNYLVNGDGTRRYQGKINKTAKKYEYFTYITTSERLRDDIMEIAIKCGYAPSFTKKKEKVNHDIWIVKWSDVDLEKKIITLESKKYDSITKAPYKGKVWCVTVPNSFFVTERNGKIAIQGNSAQVGIEAMIQRLESWRATLSEWVEKQIFLPIAMMQGFIDEQETKELGETVYLYPRLKFNDMNLRDNSNFKQMMMQLHDKKLISSRKLLDVFDIDYDQMIEELREENALTSAAGQFGGMGGGMGRGMGGGMGGMGGGLGGMGGGFGAELGGGMGGELGGGLGGELGGPPTGGGEMGLGMEGGGGEMGAAAGGMPSLKVGRRGKGGKSTQEQMKMMMPRPKMIKLTSLEQKMLKTLLELDVPYKLFGQYQVHAHGAQRPYLIDFAYPQLGVGIEADGAMWHSREDLRQRDAERDQKLAGAGWTIMRFSENEINENINDIKNIVYRNIVDIVKAKKANMKNKKSDVDDNFIKTASSENYKSINSVEEALNKTIQIDDVIYKVAYSAEGTFLFTDGYNFASEEDKKVIDENYLIME